MSIGSEADWHNFQIILACIAHNVLDIRRFDSPNKGFAKQRPGLAKCGGAKYHKGRSPTGVLRNPSRPPAAKRISFVRRRRVLGINISTLNLSKTYKNAKLVKTTESNFFVKIT